MNENSNYSGSLGQGSSNSNSTQVKTENNINIKLSNINLSKNDSQTNIQNFSSSISGSNHTDNKPKSSFTPRLKYTGTPLEQPKENLNDFENYLNDFDIEEFELKNQIGQGSFGKVYLCEHINNKNKYAIKKIIAYSKNEVKKIMSETDLVRNISHKNILKIYGMNVNHMLQDNQHTYVIYILMELALSDWNKEIKERRLNKKLYSEEQLISILKQLVDCLVNLQSMSISHRDIKPQNVLLFENNLYKLADFGDARHIKDGMTKTLRGTELYMAPLLFNAHKNKITTIVHNSYKSDVFSLGFCFLYASTLSYKSIYDLREKNDKDIINEITSNYLKNKYSDKFIKLLLCMIDNNEDSRFDFISLSNYINSNYK